MNQMRRILIGAAVVICGAAGALFLVEFRPGRSGSSENRSEIPTDPDARPIPFDSSRASTAAPPLQFAPDDWPAWRGPGENNHVGSQESPPWTWSESENVRWKETIPGRGLSSPIVLGYRVFLTTADESEQTQSVLCLDRDSGKTLWSTPVHQGEFIHSNSKNSHASSTPATDGEFVFALFANRQRVWLGAESVGRHCVANSGQPLQLQGRFRRIAGAGRAVRHRCRRQHGAILALSRASVHG